MRIRITFDAVKRQAIRAGYCPVCGRRTTRQVTFEQTINPYNLNADGRPKTWREIEVELEERARAWKPDFTHDKCRDPQETLDKE